MLVLLAGLILFLGAHSVRIFDGDLRRRVIESRGEGVWKGVYSLLSLAGLVLIVWGYGLARQDPVVLWAPPIWTRHLAILLNLVAFVLLGAYMAPAGRIRAVLGHPMVLAVKVWAFAHILANGTLADVLLFGSFLVWAIADYAVLRRRDRAEGVKRAGSIRGDAVAIMIGIVIWGAFVGGLHQWLIGVSPLA